MIGKELFTYFIRVDGSPTYSFVTALSGGILNIVLDYILVGRMQMGIYGAALATILGLVLSFLMGVYYFVRIHKSMSFTLQGLSAKEALHCMVNGASEFVDQLAIAITTIVFNRTALAFAGEDGVAAYGVVMYVAFIFAAIYIGYSMGSAPVISYNYGAENHDELRNIFKKSMIIIGTAGISLVILAEIFTGALTYIFVSYDKGLYDLTVYGMRIYVISFLISGFNMFGSSFFTALNNGFVSALISFQG